MVRPHLTLEQLVLRPGYVEAYSVLVGLTEDGAATLPEIVSKAGPRFRRGRSARVATVEMHHKLRRLAASGIVERVPLAFEFLAEERKVNPGRRGKLPEGRWKLTAFGREYYDARLSIELANRLGRSVVETPSPRKHVTQLAVPTVLLVNTESLRDDHLLRRELMENPGPTMGFTRPAQETALHAWAANSRIIADWKALHALREKHPRDNSGGYTIPQMLALKPWHPSVRAAHRRLERHRMIIVLEVNPANWDDLPIERLGELRKEHLHRKRGWDAARRRYLRTERRKAEAASIAGRAID